MIDDTIASALKGIVPNGDGSSYRVFPDIAPAGTATPYITYQATGGQAPNTLDGAANLMNVRMQVNVWASTRRAATQIMTSVIAALCADGIDAVPIGAPVSDYEFDTQLYGSRLDFSIWYLP